MPHEGRRANPSVARFLKVDRMCQARDLPSRIHDGPQASEFDARYRSVTISLGVEMQYGSAMSNDEQRDEQPNDAAALVLFSGGQDSTTCLAWALTRFRRVETVGFSYGQRHIVELSCRDTLLQGLASIRPDWAMKLGDHHTLDIPTLGELSETALTHDVAIAIGEDGLPNTFVPGRNLVFLTFAAALAYRRGITHLVGGMCETDYSGYPDCRNDTLQALARALVLGMARPFELHTPLMWRDKAETWALAHELGGPALIELIRDHSHTCYLGERGEHHDWGFGCGQCPACVLRAKGWAGYVAASTSAGQGLHDD